MTNGEKMKEIFPDFNLLSKDWWNAEYKGLGGSENLSKWIPLTKRPMTEEERENYREWFDVEDAMMFDCHLPEDGQEVLVSHGGYVCTDIFYRGDVDGCYFEGVDIDDAEAWCPLPQPYKADKEAEE